jgi:nucleotide-binding universal stress UspA family protein
MKTMLVPVDFSDVTLRVVKAAAHLAKPFHSKVILMHVSSFLPQLASMSAGADIVPLPSTPDAQTQADIRKQLDQLQHLLNSEGLESETVQLNGPPAEEIMKKAKTERVDLIVLGSHCHGPLYHLIVGGVSESILHRTRCPVLVVPVSGNGDSRD